MVTVQIHHARARPHRDALFAEIIILECDTVRDLILIAHIERLNSIHRFLDTVAIAVIRVGSCVPADRNTREAILVIIGECITAARACCVG